MNSKLPHQIIEEMSRRIVERFHPQKIILFGSHARGTASKDSDVDLLIVFSQVSSKKDLEKKIHVLLAGIGLSKDVVVVSEQELDDYKDIPGTIIHPALKEGKLLFEKAA